MSATQPRQWIKHSNYAFKLWVEQQKFPKILLGFDMGLKSTGVAVTSSDLQHAFYLNTVKGEIRTKSFREQITRLLLKEKPLGLVIGRPNYVVQAKQAENIIQAIDDWIVQMALEHPRTAQMHYTFVDQSWTTRSAQAQLKAIENEVRQWGHLSKEKDLIDGMAAINILRAFLQTYNQK